MDSVSSALLLLLAMIVFANYKNRTLGQWLRAKFFNEAAPETSGPAADPANPDQSPTTTPGPGKGGTGDFGYQPGVPKTGTIGFTGLGGALGSLLRPVSGGTITGRFGDPRAGHTHEGVDLAVPVGTAVDAARAGRVSYAGPSSGYGLRVDVDHGNGVVTRYGHLSSIRVGLGQTVTAGQLLALSGNTGDSTGPHLHFELRQNGIAIDPAPYLGTVQAPDYGRSA